MARAAISVAKVVADRLINAASGPTFRPCQPAPKSKPNAESPPQTDAPHPPIRGAPAQEGRPPLPGRRLRLHLPRLSRAAAARPASPTACRSTPCSASATCCGSCCTRCSRTTSRPISRWSSTSPRRPSATRSIPTTRRNRPAAPEDLIPQFPLIREAVRAFDLPCLEQAGFEADDLIATYARQACEAGRRRHHRVVRQGPDAAGRRRRHDARPDEGPPIGRGEVIEKFGVAAGQGHRRAGAVRRLRRQRAGRAGHRRQDRGRS